MGWAVPNRSCAVYRVVSGLAHLWLPEIPSVPRSDSPQASGEPKAFRESERVGRKRLGLKVRLVVCGDRIGLAGGIALRAIAFATHLSRRRSEAPLVSGCPTFVAMVQATNLRHSHD